MHRFTNILFSPLGEKANAAAARRVAELAERHGARLTLFGLVREQSNFQRLRHRSGLIDRIEASELESLRRKLDRWAARIGDHSAQIEFRVGNEALGIIEHVLSADHDLVVVTTDDDRHDHATIQRLLRQCPCPVWVIRPTRARSQRILAAVNPDPVEAELNRSILGLAVSMAHAGDHLHLVHAWELYGERTMRSSAFIHTQREEIEDLLDQELNRHRAALSETLSESGVGDEKWHVHLGKGQPADVICDAVAANRINLLVMGTVARTGIAGLIMGHTAESVLHRVTCSTMVTKPPGFESPLHLVVK